MADIPSQAAPSHVQDTGNPILDSVVNLSIAYLSCPNRQSGKLPEIMDALHAKLTTLAEKEPGGLQRRVTTHYPVSWD